MNRPTNVPQPPPPNMSRHIHHHNIRAPPPSAMQQVPPPPPHGMPPMGYASGPAMVPNMQQRPNRAQNYHNFIENPNSGGVVPPYMHYNRLGGNQGGNKKYHNPSLNKPRGPKPIMENHHHKQQLHQTLPTQQQQHHQQHNYSNTPSYLMETPPSTSSSTVAAPHIHTASHETRSSRPLQQNQSQESYTSNSKKISEIPRQFEVNIKKTATPRVASLTRDKVAGTTLSTTAETTIHKDMVENVVSSVKPNSLLEKSLDTLPLSEDQKAIKDGSKDNANSGKNVAEQERPEDENNQKSNDKDTIDTSNIEANTEGMDLKSSREKTPMCLVNDLARFNKIAFQYRLTGENGPAHCKRFTVTLKLGDEEYMAEGMKIKEAQHLAAKEAIQKTKYKHPIPKVNRRNDDQSASRVNVTPTVELNALAMKLGLQTYYIFDPRQPAANVSDPKMGNPNDRLTHPRYKGGGLAALGVQNQLHGGNVKYVGGAGTFVPNLAHNPGIMHMQHHRGGSNYQHCYPILPPHMVAAANQHPVTSALFSTPCKITLIVGTQKFIGSGRTIQQAKHDAAAQAIESLKEQMSSQQKESDEDKCEDPENKSPISLVFEIGIKRNLPVDFKILREDGPAHMRTFTTACIVGHIETVAEGTGKKISKKKAAQKMLDELNKLPPVVTPTTSPTKRVKTKGAAPRKSAGPSSHSSKVANTSENKEATPRGRDKSKKRSSTSADTESDPSNPITKLIELFQHNKEKEPTFKLINEGGKERARQRQFVVEVSANDITARGVGNSKKSARRNAAQNFLMSLGLDGNEKAVKENDQEKEKSGGKDSNDQVLISKHSTEIAVKTNNEPKAPDDKGENELSQKEESGKNMVSTSVPVVEKSKAAASSGSSATAAATSATTTTSTTTKPGLYMKDKLLYLARLMGFEVDFSDYPKGNHNEFLSIVMISTNPPQICHGIGANAMESQEDAASNALKILSEMGLSK
ncbi:tripartite motif-containing protein brain tumor isoform X3 [Haematobia irritans]|uniref:tripartite motif-containing protein brain tumor isoform X3 n=1 Tax=Haematobia irritans TaxID=7368 RepID=UPI003F50875A